MVPKQLRNPWKIWLQKRVKSFNSISNFKVFEQMMWVLVGFQLFSALFLLLVFPFFLRIIVSKEAGTLLLEKIYDDTARTDDDVPLTHIKKAKINDPMMVQTRVLKSDNLQYNTLGRWDDRLIDQASDVPSIIFFIISYRLRALKTLYLYFCNVIKK